MLVPVATDTRQSQDGIIRKGLHRPRLSAIIISLRPPTLILIAAPFSSRLSRYTVQPHRRRSGDLQRVRMRLSGRFPECVQQPLLEPLPNSTSHDTTTQQRQDANALFSAAHCTLILTARSPKRLKRRTSATPRRAFFKATLPLLRSGKGAVGPHPPSPGRPGKPVGQSLGPESCIPPSTCERPYMRLCGKRPSRRGAKL